MVGGDFNLVLQHGWRGDHFEELLCETGLIVSNDSQYLCEDDGGLFVVVWALNEY